MNFDQRGRSLPVGPQSEPDRLKSTSVSSPRGSELLARNVPALMGSSLGQLKGPLPLNVDSQFSHLAYESRALKPELSRSPGWAS